MAESFWKIPSVENIRTPLVILREQSTALTEQTRSVLLGAIETHPIESDKLAISLMVQVPALSDYKYRMVTYEQPITLYPGRLTFSLDGRQYRIDSEDRFIEHLRALLSSQQVNALLASLLVQAAAA